MNRILFVIFLMIGSSRSQAQSPESPSQEWWGEDIAVTDPGNAANLRKAIQAYIWGDSGWTRHSAADLQKDVNLRTDLRQDYFEMPHLRSADRLTIHLRHGFTSVVYILHPLKSNHSQVPVIYHSGHQIVCFREDRHTNDSGAYAISVLDFFLDKGFDVIGISMPLVGYNYHPREVKENGQTFPITSHDDLFQLEDPFYYFLEPIRATIDLLSSEEQYKRFIMMGLSGGGWSTTVYSAIDERIWLSFPVAGSVPNSMRVSYQDAGDKEQNLPDFYNRFNYSTLYTLAAEGPNRLSCQILNEKDECCFAFNGNTYWVPNVQSRMAQMNEPGQFQFFFDRYAPCHKVSAVAANKIYGEIKEAFEREGHGPDNR